ncbi:hypothetical protein AMATHDRAFT_45157 [Amanita thiersii Skay4041]|uniref:Uncharacterized protein n=1 Tax=Amanita thiersii Skay4041 TaxID=703135 RepID=A0A2A9P049_9AGAR|nr:hypothetical protein AMATHDRAFT_45157 [Amanita thiersii Skay4041]
MSHVSKVTPVTPATPCDMGSCSNALHIDSAEIGITNRIFSPDERQLIRDALLTARQELQGSAVKTKELQQYKIELAEKIQRYKVAIAPVKVIPPEVLHQIFIFCVSGPIEIPMKVTDARFTITLVCSHWRQVALDTPWAPTTNIASILQKLSFTRGMCF